MHSCSQGKFILYDIIYTGLYIFIFPFSIKVLEMKGDGGKKKNKKKDFCALPLD